MEKVAGDKMSMFLFKMLIFYIRLRIRYLLSFAIANAVRVARLQGHKMDMENSISKIELLKVRENEIHIGLYLRPVVEEITLNFMSANEED
jgi:hypothetical protein